MENKRTVVIFGIISLVICFITLGLCFYKSAFIPAFMLWLSLFVFDVCLYIKDSNKKIMYILFVLGVLLIVGALIYTFMRIM